MNCNEAFFVKRKEKEKKNSFVYYFPCVSITQYIFPGLSVGFINLLYLRWKTLEQVSCPHWLIFSDAVEMVVLLFPCFTQLFSFILSSFPPLPVTFSASLSFILSFYITFSIFFPLFFCLSYFFPLLVSVCLSVLLISFKKILTLILTVLLNVLICFLSSLFCYFFFLFFLIRAHSFLFIHQVGSFFMINLCLVVIATQFSETKQREHQLMQEQRARCLSSSTLASLAEPGDCYEELFQLTCHVLRKARRRTAAFIRGLRPRPRQATPTQSQTNVNGGERSQRQHQGEGDMWISRRKYG